MSAQTNTTDRSTRREPTGQRTHGMDVALVKVLVDVSVVGNVGFVEVLAVVACRLICSVVGDQENNTDCGSTRRGEPSSDLGILVVPWSPRSTGRRGRS